MNIIKVILKVVLSVVISFVLITNTGNSTKTKTNHIAEICTAVDTHTFCTPDGNLFKINSTCKDLLINESYRVVFYTFNTIDRKDDEIVDFDELEIYELSNFKTVKKFEKLD